MCDDLMCVMSLWVDTEWGPEGWPVSCDAAKGHVSLLNYRDTKTDRPNTKSLNKVDHVCGAVQSQKTE